MGWASNLFPLLIVSAGGGFTGLFVYSPAPGTNKLIMSVAAQAGTDPFGNSYLAGNFSYFNNGIAGSYQAIGFSPSGSSAANMALYTSPTDETGAYSRQWSIGDANNGFQHGLDLSGTPYAVAPGFWGISQATSVLQPVDPTSLTAAETWHTATPGNSWTGSFRYQQGNQNEVILDFSLVAPGAGVNGVTIVTLPAVYRPLANKTFPIASSGVNAGAGARMTLATTGTCQVQDVTANANPVAGLVRVPLN